MRRRAASSACRASSSTAKCSGERTPSRSFEDSARTPRCFTTTRCAASTACPSALAPLPNEALAVFPEVLDHLAVVRLAAGRDELHFAAQLGDVADGGDDRVGEAGRLLLHFADEQHR